MAERPSLAAALRDGGAAAAVGVGLRAGSAVVVGRAALRARGAVPGKRQVADVPPRRRRRGVVVGARRVGVGARGVRVGAARAVVEIVVQPPPSDHAAQPEHVVVAAADEHQLLVGGAHVGRGRRCRHGEHGHGGEEQRGVPCHGLCFSSGRRAGWPLLASESGTL